MPDKTTDSKGGKLPQTDKKVVTGSKSDIWNHRWSEALQVSSDEEVSKAPQITRDKYASNTREYNQQ